MKAVEEEDSNQKEEKVKQDKSMAELAVTHTCEVKEHKMGWCWVCNNGEHIPLEWKDLSTWALWIVSHLYSLYQYNLTLPELEEGHPK